MRLADALGDLVDVPQFFIWRLTWEASKRKYIKTPCYPDGSVYRMDASLPENWMDYQTALATLQRLGAGHCLGWWFTADAGYWFVDLDECISEAGELSELAAWFLQALPGAFTELSSSGRGMHIVGRGHVAEHACKRKERPNLEFYTEGRGIAFGLTDEADGNADTDHTVAMQTIVPFFFEPTPESEHGSGPRPEWRGPTDDAELLRRAMASQRADHAFSCKASFADLWTRNLPVLVKAYPPDSESKQFGESEADGALAMQLAFWTGCDADRIERLMWQSALKRDKWDRAVHSTYLRELTIDRACAAVSRVLIDKEVAPKLVVTTTAEQQAAGADWINRVTSAEEVELRNVVIPGIAADLSIDVLDRDRLATLVKERLAVFQIPATINQCRMMLKSVAVETDGDEDQSIPQFALEHVYLEQGDLFFHTPTATAISRTAFQARYNRAMPAKPNGDREDAAKWCLERWGTNTVHDAMYLPGREPVFMHQGRAYANLYSTSTEPPVSPYTERGIKGINAFAKHLELFCGGRQEVYAGLLAWMAFNVQNPGVKIRFAPILKGIQGDGKSLLTSMMSAAMGARNVSSAGPAIVLNSGGFTDWAHGACVIGMEEMLMQGKSRYAMANAIKENITNSAVTINRKGKSQLPIINISNFICYTNHTNAVPLEDNDRRWWVIFSPFTSVADLVAAHGVQTIDHVFDAIWEAVEFCAGEVRAWLLSMQVPDWFNPNGHAPMTAEKAVMARSGEDEDHAVARQVIDDGCVGVSTKVVSTACLARAMSAVCILEGVEVPKTSRLASLLNDLGYESHGVTKWKGKTHRIWTKGSLSNEQIRIELDRTVTSYESAPIPPIS